MIEYVDIAGHVGYVLIAIGMLLLARGRASGWIWRFAGELVWLAIGLYLDMTSMYLWGAAFLGIDAIGFVSATRKKKNGSQEQ